MHSQLRILSWTIPRKRPCHMAASMMLVRHMVEASMSHLKRVHINDRIISALTTYTPLILYTNLPITRLIPQRPQIRSMHPVRLCCLKCITLRPNYTPLLNRPQSVVQLKIHSAHAAQLRHRAETCCRICSRPGQLQSRLRCQAPSVKQQWLVSMRTSRHRASSYIRTWRMSYHLWTRTRSLSYRLSIQKGAGRPYGRLKHPVHRR